MNRDYKAPLAVLGVTIAVIAIAAPTHHSTRTIYRTPAACSRAAYEAAAVIKHHRPYQPLIDVFTGTPHKHYTDQHPFQIPDWLPAFDSRVPDLAACE